MAFERNEGRWQIGFLEVAARSVPYGSHLVQTIGPNDASVESSFQALTVSSVQTLLEVAVACLSWKFK